jgi:hypothetical protein
LRLRPAEDFDLMFASLPQETLVAGVAIGSVLLFVIAGAVAAIFHFYAKNRLARGIEVEERRRPRRNPRGRS